MSYVNPIPIEFIDLICFSHIDCKCFTPWEGEFFEGDYESLFIFVEKYLSTNFSLYEELSSLNADLTDCTVLSYYILLPKNRPAQRTSIKVPQEVTANKAQFFLTSSETSKQQIATKKMDSEELLHRINEYPVIDNKMNRKLNFTLHPQEQQLDERVILAQTKTRSSYDMNDEKLAILLSNSRIKHEGEEDEKMEGQENKPLYNSYNPNQSQLSTYKNGQVFGKVAYESPLGSEREKSEGSYKKQRTLEASDYDISVRDSKTGGLGQYLEGALLNHNIGSPALFKEEQDRKFEGNKSIYRSHDENGTEEGKYEDEMRRNSAIINPRQQEESEILHKQTSYFDEGTRMRQADSANMNNDYHNGSGYFDEDTKGDGYNFRHVYNPEEKEYYDNGEESENHKDEEESQQKEEYNHHEEQNEHDYDHLQNQEFNYYKGHTEEKSQEEPLDNQKERVIAYKPPIFTSKKKPAEFKEKLVEDHEISKDELFEENQEEANLVYNNEGGHLPVISEKEEEGKEYRSYGMNQEDDGDGDDEDDDKKMEALEREYMEENRLEEPNSQENIEPQEGNIDKNNVNYYADDFEESEDKINEAGKKDNENSAPSKGLNDNYDNERDKEFVSSPENKKQTTLLNKNVIDTNARSMDYEDDFEYSERDDKNKENFDQSGGYFGEKKVIPKEPKHDFEAEEEELELDEKLYTGFHSEEKKRHSDLANSGKYQLENSSRVSEEAVKSLNESIAMMNNTSSKRESFVSFGVRSAEKIATTNKPLEMPGKSPRFENKFSPLAKYYIENGKRGKGKIRPLSTIGNFYKVTGTPGKGGKNLHMFPPWKGPGVNTSLFEKQTVAPNNNNQLPQISKTPLSSHRRNKSANNADSSTGTERIEKQMIRALHLNTGTLERSQLVNQINLKQPSVSEKPQNVKVEKVLTQYIENKIEMDKIKLAQSKKKAENEIVADLRRKRVEKMLKAEKDRNKSLSPTSICKKESCESHKKLEKLASKPSSADKKVVLKRFTKQKDFINGILNKSEMLNGHEKALIWYKSYLGKNL